VVERADGFEQAHDIILAGHIGGNRRQSLRVGQAASRCRQPVL